MTTSSKEEIYQKSILCDNKECGKKPIGDAKFKACANCRIAHYCSPECQKAGWKSHKAFCKENKSKRDYKQWIYVMDLFSKTKVVEITRIAQILSRKHNVPLDKLFVNLYFNNINTSIYESEKFLDEVSKVLEQESLEYEVLLKPEKLKEITLKHTLDELAKYNTSFLVRCHKNNMSIDLVFGSK